MTWELGVWLAVSLAGVLTIPFVIRRRRRESRFHRLLSGNGVRAEILRNRATRAGLLSAGVVMAAAVAFASWLLPMGEERRVLSIALLVGVLTAMVITLITDEMFSNRIDAAERAKIEEERKLAE